MKKSAMPLSFFIVPVAYKANILRITYIPLPLHLIFNAKHDISEVK